MHPTVMDWTAQHVARLGVQRTWAVLEVGSYDVNGTVRPLFADAGAYVGVDVVPGPGVDMVYDGLTLPYESDTFDVVVSTEMLEHCTRPWRIVAEMARVLRPGGTLLLTARGWVITKLMPGAGEGGVDIGEVACFAYHNPPDLWRYSGGALHELALDAGLDVYDVTQDGLVAGWFIAARKPLHPLNPYQP